MRATRSNLNMSTSATGACADPAADDALLEQMRAEIADRVASKGDELLAAQRYLESWADDACFCRYLRAAKRIPRDTAKNLLATAAWRIEYGVDALDAGKLEHVMAERLFFMSRGRDREVWKCHLSANLALRRCPSLTSPATRHKQSPIPFIYINS